MTLRTPLVIGGLGLAVMLALALALPLSSRGAGWTKAVETARAGPFRPATGDIGHAGGELFVPIYQSGDPSGQEGSQDGGETLVTLDLDRAGLSPQTGRLSDRLGDGLSFVAADRRHIFAAAPHALYLFDRKSAALIHSWPEQAQVREVVVPPIVATAGATLSGHRLMRLWGVPAEQYLLPQTDPPDYRLETIDTVSFARRTLWQGAAWGDVALWGDKLVVFDSLSGQLQVFTASHAPLTSTSLAPLPPAQDTFAPDVVRVGGRHMVVLSRGRFLVIDLATRRLVSTIPTFAPSVFYAFAVDGGRLVAFPMDDRSARDGAVFDLASGRRLATLPVPPGQGVRDIALGDGRMTLLLDRGRAAILVRYRLSA